MSQDIECPKCGRISFSWETNIVCPGDGCHWVIRPPAVEAPHGYDVLLEVRGGNMINTTVEKHYKGNEATARRRARAVPGFVKVRAAVPLNQESWIRAYGEGRM